MLPINHLIGQEFQLKLTSKNTDEASIINDINYTKKHLDTISLLKEVNLFNQKLESLGFLNHTIKTYIKDATYNYTYSLGNQIKKIKIFHKKQLKSSYLKRISNKFNDSFFEIDFIDLQKTLSQIITLSEKEGKTFIKASLKNIVLNDDTLIADLALNKPIKRKINKIVVNGYEDFPKTFLTHYLDIQKNDVFNEKKLLAISNEINLLPFVSEIKAPEILFTKDSTAVYLYLKKENTNTFDGLIGFSNSEDAKNISFNGYLNLHLNNIFNKGQSFSLKWKNNGNEKQQFNIYMKSPYIFNTAFTPSINFNIYKQDSTFLNTKTNFNIDYRLSNNNTLGFLYENEESSDLQNDSQLNESITGFKTTMFGVSYLYEIKNDEFLFPIKFNVAFNGLHGSKKTDNTNSKQQKLAFSSTYLFDLNLKSNLYLKAHGSYLISDTAFTNELYRIGGANSIRGFNEESILASFYGILNLESRYKISESSYFYTLTDLGYLENNIDNFSNNLIGLGIGYAFISNLGFVNLSYALGKNNNIPLQFKNSKFHINIIHYF